MMGSCGCMYHLSCLGFLCKLFKCVENLNVVKSLILVGAQVLVSC
jgi:hypothetical protein